MFVEFSVFATETSFGAHINRQEVKDMIKAFRQVPTKTVDFCSLAAGDCFYYGNTYYMKLIIEYTIMDDECYYNSIDLESGALTFFCSRTKVKPYKECEVILHE